MSYNTKVEYREYYRGNKSTPIVPFNKIFLSYLTMGLPINPIDDSDIKFNDSNDRKTISFIFDKIPNRVIIFNPQMQFSYSNYYTPLKKYFNKDKLMTSIPKHFDIFFDYDDIIENKYSMYASIISNIYQSIIKYKEYHKVGVQLPKINIYILTKDESRNWCKHDGIKFRNKAIPKYYNLLKDNGYDEKYFHIESCRYFLASDKNSGYEIHIRKDKYDGILHTTIERDTTRIRKEDD